MVLAYHYEEILMDIEQLMFIGSSEDEISNDLLTMVLGNWDHYELVFLTKGVEYKVRPNSLNVLIVGGPSPREQLSWMLKIVKRPDMIVINTHSTKQEQRVDMRALVREMEEFIGTECVHECDIPTAQEFYEEVVMCKSISDSDSRFHDTRHSYKDDVFICKLTKLFDPKTDWIDIRAMKPKHHQHVVYYFKEVGTHVGQYERTEYGDCFYSNAGYLTDDVTHWIPLPDRMPTVKPFRLIKIKDDFHGKLRSTKICPWCGRHGNIYSCLNKTADGCDGVLLPVCEYCWAQLERIKQRKRRKKKVVKPNKKGMFE